MLRSEGLVMGCTGECLLYLRICREGQFVVLRSVFCVGGIFSCIGSSNNSYVYFYDMFLIVTAYPFLSRIRVYFVACTLPRRIVDYWILRTSCAPCVLCLWICETVRRMICWLIVEVILRNARCNDEIQRAGC